MSPQKAIFTHKALLWAMIAIAAPVSANSVITADRMIDVQTGKIVEYPAIFVDEDGRITGVSDARVIKWSADVKHIDLSGKTILPGLIDMHVHLDSPANIGGYRGLEFTDSFWGMAAVGNADAESDKLAKQYGTCFSMDIYNTEYTQSEGKKNGELEDNLRKDREIAQAQRDNFKRAHKNGVCMVFGSDAGVMPHGEVGKQFRVMVEYGMTPIEAIQAATRNAAKALSREKDVGAIEVGRYADLIAVDGNPLIDVRELEDVDAVLKGGVQVR